MSVLLEICVDSIASARAARDGGADRLEVCNSLAVGGTTPSYGLVQQCVAEIGLPVMMMIRPHDGDFVYSDDDLDVMERDIDVAKQLGVQGVVFGILTPKGAVQQDHCRRLLDRARPLDTTFHRAIDVVGDPIESVKQVAALGFRRLLTSGQSATAEEGVKLIAELQMRVQNQLALIAAAGVNADNAARIVSATGVRELHASASVAAVATEGDGAVSFGDARRVTHAENVRAIKRHLNRHS